MPGQNKGVVLAGKLLAAAFVSIILASAAHSADIFYVGFAETTLEKESLKAGEALKGYVSAGNSDAAAFYDSEIILEIAAGPKGSIGYPSQLSDAGNIFIEQKLPVSLLPGQEKKVAFEVALPKDLAPGTYTILTYFRTKRSPIVGIPHILLNPMEKEFTVEGSGKFPQLAIVRTKTEFGGDAGPIGTPVNSGQDIAGKVFLKNSSGEAMDGVTVWAGLCDWDDTACDKFISEATANANLASGEEKPVELSIKAPELPGAYAIRIEVRDKAGRVISLYRNRAIVEGGTARIKKLAFYGTGLEPGIPSKIYLLLGASPDHYTKPDFSDFDVSIWMEKDGKKLFNGKEHIPVLKFRDAEKEITANFTPELEHKEFSVCSAVEKGGTTYDKYCFEVFPMEIDYSGKKGEVRIETSFAEAPSELSVKACGFAADGSEEDVNISVSLVESENFTEIAHDAADQSTCFEKDYPAERKKYTVLVNDFRNGKQLAKEIDLSEERAKSCQELGGTICIAGEKCSGSEIDAPELGVCCAGACQGPSKTSIEDYKEGFNVRWEFLVLAGIILAVLLLILLSARRPQNAPQ